MQERLLPDSMNAATPWKTMHARLSVHIRDKGIQSTFIRTARGKYAIRRGLLSEEYEAPQRQPPKGKERVLVFPSEILDSIGRFQGINTDWQPIYRQLVQPSVCRFMDRVQAEQDDEHKQIVAYVMVTQGSKVLAFKRGNYNRAADFLRGCQCIGFGGHVSQSDYSAFDMDNLGIINCASRELAEEVRLPDKDGNILTNLQELSIVGILNDDSSQNGRRHIAVVFRYEASNEADWKEVKRRELSINELRWLDLANPDFSLWDFEYWSQLCFRKYFPDAIHIQPSFKIVRKRPLSPPHLLCVIGQLGSGKSEATRVLTNDFNYAEINSGRVLADLLGIEHVSEASRATFQAQAWHFINQATGPTQLATEIWKRVSEHKSKRILIDGIRQRSTLEEIKRLAGRRAVGLLYVHTPPDLAFEFYKHRINSVGNIHDFLKVREAPVESEVADMIGMADAVLYNWQGVDMLRNTLCKLMSEIQK